MKAPSKEILILGFGSDILSDEGIAIRLIHDLKKNWNEQADLNTYLTFSLDVIYDIAGYENIFFIDASEDIIPGKVRCLSFEKYKQTLHLNNYHDVSLIEGLDFGKKLGLKISSDVIIISISVSEIGLIDDQFSIELQKKYPQILKETDQLIKDHVMQFVD